MTDRPIIFGAQSVRATLAGEKTQTRRVVKITHRTPGLAAALEPPCGLAARPNAARELCPFGQPADRLWVRERWSADFDWPTDEGLRGCWWHEIPAAFRGPKNLNLLYFAADHTAWEHCGPDIVLPAGWTPTEDDLEGVRWQPSIHMPRWASRLSLELTAVRVERLQDITENDARAEGCHDTDGAPTQALSGTARGAYARLWDDLNRARGYSWGTNPWVWVLEFALQPFGVR